MKYFKSSALAASAMMFAFALPGSATTILGFSSTSTGGTITTSTSGNGTNIGISALSNVPYTTLTEIPGTAVAISLTLTYNSSLDELILAKGAGTSSSLFSNISAGTTIETIDLSGLLTATVSGSSFTLNVPTVSGIVTSSTFAGDLGIVGPITFSSISVQGTESGTTVTDTSNTLSETAVVSSTPEPVSFVLLGSGLVAAGFMRRKKLFGAAK